GTTNFAQGIPYFCVSVALTHNDERILGAVYQPCTDEMFYATKGDGATLNGQSLHVLETKDFSKAIISCALSYKIDETLYNAVGVVEPEAYSVRIMGAAALDIAYCAAGRFDGVFFGGLSWWDIAAGSLVLEEAGGRALTLKNQDLDSRSRSFIGGSELIFEKLNDLIKK
ncbi:MAG: myo-inositol-1(or 4)-monophosphatase, partial [Alteromonas naphthalenivorans]